ncbi:MAG: caspase family protein [Candidatus Aminicenantes bacterium]|jgi:hypothetical protein
MKKVIFFLILLIIILLSQIIPAAAVDVEEADKITTRRFAFVIGANNGGPDRVTLRYAVTDAKSMIKVLEDLGGVLPDDTRFLVEPDRGTFFREMSRLEEKVNRAKSGARRVEVIFYYSGHSDDQNILLGSDRVSYKEFRNKINRINADVRIAVLDSCASGAFNLLKGVKKKAPFLVDTAYEMKGFAFMTSSSSLEASQESGKLKGSFFTHHLISGLRGAADMTQDGMITLSEAYQYAYKETLSHTENTISGPQHPMYNIQMSGKGDVIMTDIRKSSSVLVIGKNIFGRVFIHNQENVLVVEINKPFGRDIEIGLETGKYRVINIRDGNIYESRIALTEGMSYQLKVNQFKETKMAYALARGNITFPPGKMKNRFQVEFFGGFSTLNPEDLNLRATREEQADIFYEANYLNYLRHTGTISSYTKEMDGNFKLIKNAAPFGFRLKYFLNRSMAISLGFEYMSRNQPSNIKRRYTLAIGNGDTYLSHWNLYPYNLSTKGYIPTLGIHLGKRISGSLGVEGFISAGPVFAQCGYLFEYETMEMLDSGINGDNPELLLQNLEENGKGTGFSLRGGARLNIDMGRNFGLFLEGEYAHQVVNKISGSGENILDFETETWQAEWGVKGQLVIKDWGQIYYIWPSNYWFNEQKDLRIGDFKLDLSGFRMKIGIFYRF